MLNQTKISTLILLCLAIFSLSVFAADHTKNTPSNVKGSVTINIDTKNVKNIMSNTHDSAASVHIGTIKKSTINGKVTLEKINVGDVNNSLENTKNSSASVKIGNIENSTINNATIKVDINKIDNKVIGGKNNHASIKSGTIENSTISGKTTLDIKVHDSIQNTINGGSDNTSEVSIGMVSGQNQNGIDTPKTENTIPHDYTAKYANGVGPSFLDDPTLEASNRYPPSRRPLTPEEMGFGFGECDKQCKQDLRYKKFYESLSITEKRRIAEEFEIKQLSEKFAEEKRRIASLMKKEADLMDAKKKSCLAACTKTFKEKNAAVMVGVRNTSNLRTIHIERQVNREYMAEHWYPIYQEVKLCKKSC